jgi:hypothetical protein
MKHLYQFAAVALASGVALSVVVNKIRTGF